MARVGFLTSIQALGVRRHVAAFRRRDTSRRLECEPAPGPEKAPSCRRTPQKIPMKGVHDER
jgi:hypothetical protein